MDSPDIRPDNPAFLIFGIQPDTGFDLPDIRLFKNNAKLIYSFFSKIFKRKLYFFDYNKMLHRKIEQDSGGECATKQEG
jgi:hypothetical protein